MSGNAIEFDTVLELCRDQHRRIVLAALADQQQSVTLDDLVKTIVEYNHHTPISEISEEVLTRIKLSLYHEHVPKLEALAVVEYDPDRQLVEPTNRFDRLQPHLSTIIDADPDLEAPVDL